MSLSTMFKSCGNSENLRTFTDRVLADLTAIRTAAAASIVDRAASLVPIAALIVDRAANKTEIDLAATWAAEVDSDLDTINDILDFDSLDGVIGGDYAIVGAAATTWAASGRIKWRRNGQIFETAMPATLTMADDGDITQNKYRAFRVEISDLGAVTMVAGGDLESTTAEQALLALSAVAPTASTVTIAYVCFQDSTGAFDIGTTNTADAENITYYYERMPRAQAAGLTAAMVPGLAIGTTPEEFSHGTVDGKALGVGRAQITPADVTQAFNNNDIVTTSGKFGGWLICTDLAGTDVLTLCANGVFEGAQTVDYASLAAVTTALDNCQARIPTAFTVLGRCTVETGKATWTANVDAGDDADGTFTFTSEGVGAFDRTVTSGTGQGPVRPTTPATITAPLFDAADAATAVAATAPTASAPAAITTVALTYE